MTDSLIQDISDIWTKSKYEKPNTLLIDNNGNNLIVISSTPRLHRCMNKERQIIVISVLSSSNGGIVFTTSTPNKETNSSTPYLLECIPQDIDIFVKEKICPSVYDSE